MRYVILRDDDTNALTPVADLERLYRPFLARGLPVNLAVIPEVRADSRTLDGRREGFLPTVSHSSTGTVAMRENRALVEYLQDNPGYCVVQHGCHHDPAEFDSSNRAETISRLDRGRRRLAEAGLGGARAFVAPHDKLSPVAYEEVARRFDVVSTGWFEWGRVPLAWRPRYLIKKLTGAPHWRMNGTRLLSHPGCLLSHLRPRETMLAQIKAAVARRQVTVLVTHWWEYFRSGVPDEDFIRVLHETAEFLATQPDLAVISFNQLAAGNLPAVGNARGLGASLRAPVAPMTPVRFR